MEWRGKKYPLTSRRMSFRHETVEHLIQYRTGDFPEPVAPHGYLFTYTIPMRDGVKKGGYGKLFTDRLLELITDMRDKRRGPLVDPVYGKIEAVPISYSDESDVLKRDGVDISIELLESSNLEDDFITVFQGGVLSIGEVLRGSEQLDVEAALVKWGQEPSPEPNTDILSAINGAGALGLAQVGRVGAKMHDLAYRLEKIEETAGKIEDPAGWRLLDGARRLRLAAVKLGERVSENPFVKIKRNVYEIDRTLSEVASELGNTVFDLIKLNPVLSRSPRVKAGTPIYSKEKQGG